MLALNMFTDWIFSPQAWIALITLTSLEIVLGIDNIIFLTILVGRLPEKNRPVGRILGLSFAMLTRILLLCSLVWIARLTTPLFTIVNQTFSGRDLILIVGGLFLLGNSTLEIHHAIEGSRKQPDSHPGKIGLLGIIIQIGLIDIVFSLDSVITAVGLADNLTIMILAIMIAIFVMMFAAKIIGDFVDKYPTLKMLALSFLILVGFALIGEGFDLNIPKGYIYFAMFYSLAVETLNIKLRK